MQLLFFVFFPEIVKTHVLDRSRSKSGPGAEDPSPSLVAGLRFISGSLLLTAAQLGYRAAPHPG